MKLTGVAVLHDTPNHLHVMSIHPSLSSSCRVEMIKPVNTIGLLCFPRSWRIKRVEQALEHKLALCIPRVRVETIAKERRNFYR